MCSEAYKCYGHVHVMQSSITADINPEMAVAFTFLMEEH